MSWWGSRRPTEKLPKPIEPPIDRQAELLAELRAIETELAIVNDAMRTFRSDHSLRVNRFGQITGMQVGSMNAWPQIDKQWRVFQKTISGLFPQRNRILRELARLKVPDYV